MDPTFKQFFNKNDSRAKYIRERCKIYFGPGALKSVRKYKGDDGEQITTVEVDIKYIDGL